ncbi:MAG: DUF1287 domain-containing protein [Alphaproteobacteria bacterium]|nr:DUF1287 domain-containing protein [Alphaproteobacteria bacterium]
MKILYIIFASLLFNHTLFLTQLSASCPSRQIKNLSQPLQNKIDDMISAATKQVGLTTIYNPSYKKLKYPMGDVPMHEGVCTDVIIRAMRTINIDLQKDVHESMKLNRDAYPKKWGFQTIDKNIDHRRVHNLVAFFKLKGMEVTEGDKEYKPGDIIVWDLGSGQHHIGLLSNQKTADGKAFLIIHNICCGVKIENILNNYPIVAHFRLFKL